MYDLKPFKEYDETVVREFVDQHPFAMIVGCDHENKPVATQIPVFIIEHEGKQMLRGHIMKNTDHHKAFLHNPNVLVVFTSPHVYVSATWYSNPQQASTWNYISVHAKGQVKFLDDAGLIEMLRKTTLYFEGQDETSSTIYDNLSPEYTRPLMKAIVAFEIEIQEMENVFKLSQNRDAQSFHNIMVELKKKGPDGLYIVAEMEKRKKSLYPEFQFPED